MRAGGRDHARAPRHLEYLAEKKALGIRVNGDAQTMPLFAIEDVMREKRQAVAQRNAELAAAVRELPEHFFPGEIPGFVNRKAVLAHIEAES